MKCHFCESPELVEIETYRELCRVTSDCRGWPADGRLAVCESCGLVQAIIDDRWRKEASEIYRDYEIYYQSGGEEQPVFGDSGVAAPRSQELAEKLRASAVLPESGSLLDVGCGNGAFLRAFGAATPGWRLFGTELSDKYQETVEALPGVEKMFVGDLDQVKGTFDVVSLIHVLEHIEAPHRLLASVADRLTEGGVVFVEVPYFVENPFDLVIADHSSHFTEDSMRRVAAACGLRVLEISIRWVSKELSCVLAPASRTPEKADDASAGGELEVAGRAVNWLRHAKETICRLAGATPFGIFGTSIGANWLLEEMRAKGQSADFFVDEDPTRIGRELHGKPIVEIAGIPEGAAVAIPLAPVTAAAVGKKLAASRVRVIAPDPL